MTFAKIHTQVIILRLDDLKVGTVDKCTASNGADIASQNHIFQIVAAFEGGRANVGHALRNGNAAQVAAGERASTDYG